MARPTIPPSPLARRVLTWLPCEGAVSTNCDTASTCASRQYQWRDMHKPPTLMARHVPMWISPAIASCETYVDRNPPLLPARQVHLARALFVSHLQARLNHLLATICRLGLNHLQARSCSCARRVTCIQCGLQSAWLNGQTTSCNFGLVTCML